MHGFSIVMNDGFHSGACLAMPRHIARAAYAVRRAVGTRTGAPSVKDYCLMDVEGHHLGTVPAALRRPSLGSSAPTVYLHREFRGLDG